MTEWYFTASILEAKTPRELERVWLWNYRKNNVTTPRGRVRQKRASKARYEALKREVEKRGWELVSESPIGWKVPRLKLRGHQYTATMGTESYKTGHWGNGAGYRYAMYYLEEWVKKHGKYRSHNKATAVVDWVIFGMPHRALIRIGKVI